MRELLAELDTWTVPGHRVAIATVIATGGSAPRPIGAKMAVDDQGRIAGAVSGGCVEGAVVELAERVLTDDEPRTGAYGISDAEAWAIGLPCGGQIEVDVALWAPTPGSPQARFATLAAAGQRAALVTALDGPREQTLVIPGAGAPREQTLGAPRERALLAPEAVAVGAPLSPATRAAARALLWADRSALVHDGGRRWFVDVVAPPPRLILVGAVPVAQALCRAARDAGWRPFVVDPRGRFATPERLPAAERVVVAWPEEGFAQLGGLDPATAVIALSHDPKIDDPALALAVRSRAAFVGAMGSRRATADRRERLAASGLTAAELDRISAPIGLDLGGIGDAETALSIMAELVAVRHGRPGGRLSTTDGTIHVRSAASPLAA
ncbi:MAG TPA: XdhC family protein [Baekduia sp.]